AALPPDRQSSRGDEPLRLRAARSHARSGGSLRFSLAAAPVGRKRSVEHRAAQIEGRQGRASPRNDRALLADGQDDQGEADGPGHIDRRRGWKGRGGWKGWGGFFFPPPF